MGEYLGGRGIARVEKRAQYLRLMSLGTSSAAACAEVGIHVRTGARWRNGRAIRDTIGGTRFYPPITTASTQPKSARYLNESERIVIADGLRCGLSPTRIAALLPGRAVSTVYREVKRNSSKGAANYRPHAAQDAMLARRPRPKKRKLETDIALREKVQSGLDQHWSPEQISAVLARDTDGPQVSVESIYQAVYSPNSPLKRHTKLRTGRVRRKQRRHATQRTTRFAVPMTPLEERPDDVELREEGGHWEGDLIVGKDSGSAIATVVERKTRFTILVHLGGGRSAEQVRDELIKSFELIPPHARLSLTWDQGMEMSRHHEISQALSMPVYFCESHSPWQRGTNENTNGLLREYFPKGTDLNVHSKAHLASVATELNNRPRKTLGFDTPAQHFATLTNTYV
jgi:transposase, IS30 family